MEREEEAVVGLVHLGLRQREEEVEAVEVAAEEEALHMPVVN